MARQRKSHNERIYHYLMRRTRRTPNFTDANYLIFYTFLYKYLSDRLRSHLLHEFGGKGDDLKEFYLTEEGKADIREVALNDLGYFIERYDAYIDQFIGDNIAGDFLNPGFFKYLKEHMVFSKANPCEEYFNIIMETLEGQTRFGRWDSDQDLFISNYLLSISKLNIDEEEFSFQKVYDLISFARQVRMSPTPEYITQILEQTVTAKKESAESCYDPFLRDASNLFNVSGHFEGCDVYGKESDCLHYFYSIIKAFIYEYDFNNVFFEREDAIESMPYGDELFDVIVSKIPYHSRFSPGSRKNQNLEAPNPNKVDIKEQLISQFDLSALGEDEELLKALSVVEKKVEAAEKSNIMDFEGEYESLKDSEFLFLINMINCIKEDGLMAVSLSQNFLFKKSLTTLRKFLTYENNYIDTIISLPEELGSSIRPEVIIAFRKNKNIKDILFVDLSKEYDVVSSKSMMPGRIRRNLILDETTLAKVRDVLKRRVSIDQFSEVISIRELEENDFNLTVSRYVDTFDGDFIRLEDLTSTKKEIDNNIEELNKKIDMMMRDLKL